MKRKDASTPSELATVYAAERSSALANQSLRFGQILDDRNTGKLGDGVVWMAQALLLCTLPYRQTLEQQIVRKARLGVADWIEVTFSAGIAGVPLPFGSDRRLLAWLLDRALSKRNPVIAWESAWEYQQEMGLTRSGKSNANLQASFRRLSGLNIHIERIGRDALRGVNRTIIEEYFLPRSITGRDDRNQISLSGIEAPKPYGVTIGRALYEDMQRHGMALPRRLWMQPCGCAQVHDMLLFFAVRCFAARTETLIPWDSLAEQFSRDSNPRRQRSHARDAILILRHLWPGVSVDAQSNGIVVDRAMAPMLPDAPELGRISKIPLPN